VDAVALRRTITASLSYSDFRKMLRSYRPTIARAALMKARAQRIGRADGRARGCTGSVGAAGERL
jgi:CRP-like cAMP-binding protein